MNLELEIILYKIDDIDVCGNWMNYQLPSNFR